MAKRGACGRCSGNRTVPVTCPTCNGAKTYFTAGSPSIEKRCGGCAGIGIKHGPCSSCNGTGKA